MKENDEYLIRTSATGTRQVKVKFIEDDRRVSHLWFQKWNTQNDTPIGEQVVIYGEEFLS